MWLQVSRTSCKQRCLASCPTKRSRSSIGSWPNLVLLRARDSTADEGSCGNHHPHQEEGNLRVVVETPRGSLVKLRYEPMTGTFVLQKYPQAGEYPYDCGFIPCTRAEDGDRDLFHP